ncbi:MAG: acyltransferase domain-containing protein [Patescibacteria group bacterium]
MQLRRKLTQVTQELEKVFRKRIKIAWVFPGQGKEVVEMSADIKEALLEIWEPVERVLKKDYADMLFYLLTTKESEIEEAKRPWAKMMIKMFAQPAVFIDCYCRAQIRLKKVDRGEEKAPDFLAGPSLGEITALVVGGALSFSQGLRLVMMRNFAMFSAAYFINDGCMIAVFGDSKKRTMAENYAKKAKFKIANTNNPEEVVFSGPRAILKKFTDNLEKKRIGYKVLETIDAFHNKDFMGHPQQTLNFVLDLPDMEISSPSIPVFSCLTKNKQKSPRQIKRNLIDSVINPTDFSEVVFRLVRAGCVASTIVEVASPNIAYLANGLKRFPELREKSVLVEQVTT